MSAHEQFADDLALYALQALEGEERLALEKHLETCPACRQEVEKLRGDVALLALSVSGPTPPSRCRERLMVAVAKESRRSQPRLSRPMAWWRVLEWGAAVTAVALIAILLRQSRDMRRHIAELETNTVAQQQQLVQAKELMATLTSADAVHFTLVAGKTPPQPQGKAIYVRTSGTLVFLASNMPELPPQKTYELWLIPASGAPIPAGLFKPNPRGSATVIRPTLPPGVEAKTFAITIEPAAGSSAPTSQPIMVGIRG